MCRFCKKVQQKVQQNVELDGVATFGIKYFKCRPHALKESYQCFLAGADDCLGEMRAKWYSSNRMAEAIRKIGIIWIYNAENGNKAMIIGNKILYYHYAGNLRKYMSETYDNEKETIQN